MGSVTRQEEQRIEDMGDAIGHVWQAMDVIHNSEHLNMDDLNEIVDQARSSWTVDENGDQ